MPESKDTVAQANDQLAGYVPLAIVVPAGFTKNSGKHKVGATEDNEPAWLLPAVATAMVAGDARNKWSAGPVVVKELRCNFTNCEACPLSKRV